jgi:predicted small secreted protein
MIRKLSAIFLLGLFLTGCNTMSGVGKDIERGGEKLQGSAERNK